MSILFRLFAFCLVPHSCFFGLSCWSLRKSLTYRFSECISLDDILAKEACKAPSSDKSLNSELMSPSSLLFKLFFDCLILWSTRQYSRKSPICWGVSSPPSSYTLQHGKYLLCLWMSLVNKYFKICLNEVSITAESSIFNFTWPLFFITSITLF